MKTADIILSLVHGCHKIILTYRKDQGDGRNGLRQKDYG